MVYNLAYLATPKAGGWVTMTARHLKYNYPLFKVKSNQLRRTAKLWLRCQISKCIYR